MRTYIFITIIILVSLLTGCTTSSGTVINASESNTSTKMSMSYDKFNGYKERVIEVKEGKPIIVTVNIVTKSGSIDAYITRDNDIDNSSYEGHDIQTTKFSVTLSEQGRYTIRVDANNHSGSYSFSWGE